LQKEKEALIETPRTCKKQCSISPLLGLLYNQIIRITPGNISWHWHGKAYQISLASKKMHLTYREGITFDFSIHSGGY
jgi:hypothetical protein